MKWLSDRRFFAVLTTFYICLITFVAWRMLGKPTIGADDANIVFVYARNFSHGHGIVYNVGGEHVEGFSSILYFLVCSVFYAISSKPEPALLLLSVLLSVLANICMVDVLNRLADRLQLPLESRLLLIAGGLLWLVLNPCYFAWTTISLMDTGLYSVVLCVSFWFLARLAISPSQAVEREAHWLAVIVALTYLSRPEGVLWAALQVAAFGLLTRQHGDRIADMAKRLRLPLLALVVLPLAVTSFRVAYFGYPLPNTYYAKVSSSLSATLADGWAYAESFFTFYGVVILAPILCVLLWVAYSAMRRGIQSELFAFATLTVAFTIAGLTIPIFEGGDHFFAFRMYQPVYPLLYVCLTLPAFLWAQQRTTAVLAGYAAVLAVAITLTTQSSWSVFEASNGVGAIADLRVHIRGEFNIAANERRNGERLRAFFGAHQPTIGTGSAGGIAYGYEGTVYDMMGLNNTRMAHADAIKTGPKGHQSFNKKVFDELSPDILLPNAVPAGTPVNLSATANYYRDPALWDNRMFKGLFNDPSFNNQYKLALVSDAVHPESICYGFFRADFLLRLAASPGVHILIAMP